MIYTDFKMCDINLGTSKNTPTFKKSVIVLDDRGYKLNKDITFYFTKGRNYSCI